MKFVRYVSFLSKIFHVRVFWENTNILNTTDWSYIENPSYIPNDTPLCFDLGHFILGEPSKEAALKKIDSFFSTHGSQIKHLHLHINDLKRDLHNEDQRQVVAFLGTERFNKLTQRQTYIFENG